MNRLACRHDPVARLEARLRYRPCRGSFEGVIRLDPIETHHLRFLLLSNIGGPGGLLWPGPGAPQPRRKIHPVAVVPYEGTTMKTPLQIAFHNLPHSRVIESAIQEAADRLEDTHDRITSCRVIVDQPHRHHKEGNHFQVRIDLKMAGTELVVKREHAGGLAYGDLTLVIQDAFEEMQGQIEEFVNRRRGFVKTHEDLPHGRVIRLYTEAGYGFLETLDGREVFFHRNSVLGPGFSSLDVGTEVSFVEELGEKGPQASTVKIVGRHNHIS